MNSACDRRGLPRAYVAATATVVPDGGEIAHYLVANISGSGALLTDGPPLVEGQEFGISLHVAGCRPMTGRAVVKRKFVSAGSGAYAITYKDLNLAAVTRLRIEALLAEERKRAPSILIVSGEVDTLGNLASTVAALGRRPIVTCSAIGAMRWLSDSNTSIQAILVRSRLHGADGSNLLCALEQEFPHVLRILLHDPGAPEPRHPEAAEAIALAPWDHAALKKAFQGHLTEHFVPNPNKRRIRSGIEPIA